jgi:hypothetical protein
VATIGNGAVEITFGSRQECRREQSKSLCRKIAEKHNPALFLHYSDRFLLEKQSQNHYFSFFFGIVSGCRCIRYRVSKVPLCRASLDFRHGKRRRAALLQ